MNKKLLNEIFEVKIMAVKTLPNGEKEAQVEAKLNSHKILILLKSKEEIFKMIKDYERNLNNEN